MAGASMKIGDLAKATGFTTKTIRYYEEVGLLPPPQRSESGYRSYSQEDAVRLLFIGKAKHIGLSLEDIRGILTLHDQRQAPCIHVLALLDQKLEALDRLIGDLGEFRAELTRLRRESAERLDELPQGASICGIIERNFHSKGVLALAWLEARQKTKAKK